MININTFLRPALPEDVFRLDGLGEVIDNKQFYFKELEGSFYGPQRIFAKKVSAMYSMPKDEQVLFVKKQEIEAKEVYEQILELLQAMAFQRLFVIDATQYLESVAISLPLKKTEEFDIVQGDALIPNTMYYLKKGTVVDGPFFINEKTTKKDLKNKALNKTMLVLHKPCCLNPVKEFSLMAG
jgi:hypothetical protein